MITTEENGLLKLDSTHVNKHFSDDDYNPLGGMTCGCGFCISWQNGPRGKGADREEPNGADVVSILQAAKDRLQFYQNSKFACEANQVAIDAILNAIQSLDDRTSDREVREVEGVNEL